MCDGQEFNLDHANGHQHRTFSFDLASANSTSAGRPLWSIHFQGSRKGDIARFTRTPLSKPGAWLCEVAPGLACKLLGEIENRVGELVDPYRRSR